MPGDTPIPVSSDEVEAQLRRVLASPQFAASRRLAAFLRFIVGETLAGRSDLLKEYTVARAVYDRAADFDPKADSIVRTEAHRLRSRLEAYYEGPGAGDPVRITVSRGSYVPTLRGPDGLGETDTTIAEAGDAPYEREAPVPSGQTPSGGHRRGLAWIVPTALAGVVLVTATLLLQGGTRRSETADLLIAAFEDRTGDGTIDGAVAQALEFAIGDSPSIRVVPRVRIEDTLRLMTLAPGTRLTPDVAREIVARDPDVDAVLSGALSKTSGGYALDVALSSADQEVPDAAAQFTMPSLDGVTTVATHVARWVLRRIGTTPGESRPGLERVSTRSLRALQSYSQAMPLLMNRNWVAADALLGDAVAADPAFASARIYHAWTMRNLDRTREEVLAEARHAEVLAHTAIEREQLFIHASVRALEGRNDEAIALYKVLLQRHPDHYWGLNNVTQSSADVDPARGAEYWARFADLRPTDFNTNLRTAERLALGARQPEAALRYLQRARAAARDGDSLFAVDWLAAYGPWVAGDVRPLRAVLHTAESLTPPTLQNDWQGRAAGLVLLATGRTEAAEVALAWMGAPVVTRRWSAVAAAARGDRATLRAHAATIDPDRPNALSMILLTWAGLTTDADAMSLERERTRVPGATRAHVRAVWEVADGQRALAADERDRALERLDAGFHALEGSLYPEYFMAALSLAEAAEADGNLERAVAVLRRAVAQRASAYAESLVFWVGCARRLAAVERARGQDEAAGRLERELADLLEGAEPGFAPEAIPSRFPVR